MFRAVNDYFGFDPEENIWLKVLNISSKNVWIKNITIFMQK